LTSCQCRGGRQIDRHGRAACWSMAFFRVVATCSWPTTSSNCCGRHLRPGLDIAAVHKSTTGDGDWLIRSPITNYRSPKKTAVHPASTNNVGLPIAVKLQSATRRHMEHRAYRCCLPTLAGFAGNHCIGPGLQRRPRSAPPRRACTGNSAQLERVAGYREPLPPA